jgi:energy-coupling factor transport system ATP-binding protein
VLVLDEPTSQLDPQGAEDVLAGLQRLVHDLGITVIIAEHRLERVAGFAEVVVGCTRGHVIIGEPAAALNEIGIGPPVARLGRALGWSPLPLTVRSARNFAEKMSIPERPPAVPRPPEPGAALLTASGLRATYGSGDVLNGIDLGIARGDIVAILGRNGSGKTTLLRCLAGLHPPSGGTVSFRSQPPRPGVDVVLCPQSSDSILFEENVAAEIAATARGGRGEELLARFGIADLAASHPRDLSAGQRVLVATAAIAATGAPVLLLDEPTRGLDPDTKRQLSSILREWAEDGHAVAFATHDVELAAAVATRVVLLATGEVITEGGPREVLSDSPVFSPQIARVFGHGWLTPDEIVQAVTTS